MGTISASLNLSMGGDASASRRTAWLPLNGYRKFSLEISLPATNSPVGVISIEVSNNGVTGRPIPSLELVGLTQPSGGAWACLLDNITTDAEYVAVVYTRTSGGFGAAFGDGAGDVITGPKLVMKGSFETALNSATALDLRTVRVVFSPPSDSAALDVGAWSFTGLSTPPFVIPTVAFVDDVLGDGSTFDLFLVFELSPRVNYRVTYSDGRTADFTAPALPTVTGRSFRLLDWIPDKNLREDDSGDLRKFVSVIDENIGIILNDVDQFGNIQDPDQAVEQFVEQMLADLGNPFTAALVTLSRKRLLVKLLIPIFKSIGTAKGLIDAVWFFLGFQAALVVVNRQGMKLGVSLLTVDWVLGCGPDKWRIILKVSTPLGRALNDYENRVLAQIINTMKYAHERIEIQATLDAPTGVSAIAIVTPGGIRVSWSPVAGALSYIVYMTSVTGTTPRNGSPWTSSGTSLDLHMTTGSHRYFVVVAVNAQGEGLPSAEVSVVSG